MIRRNGWYLAGVALLATGVFVPGPKWMRVTVGLAGFAMLMTNVSVMARHPDTWGNFDHSWHAFTVFRAISRWLILPGLAATGYLLAATLNHGGFGPVYTSAQLDAGKEFGNANAAFFGAVLLCGAGAFGISNLPWVSDADHRPKRPLTACTYVAYFCMGPTAYVAGRALF